jgi:chaperonin cofactor prefoldin
MIMKNYYNLKELSMKKQINILALSVLLLQMLPAQAADQNGYCYDYEQPEQGWISMATPNLGMLTGALMGSVVGTLRFNSTVKELEQKIERLEHDIGNREQSLRDKDGMLEWTVSGGKESMTIIQAIQSLLNQEQAPLIFDVKVDDFRRALEKKPVESLRGPKGKDAQFDARSIAAALLENSEYKKEVLDHVAKLAISEQVLDDAMEQSKLRQEFDDYKAKIDEGLNTLNDKIRSMNDWLAHMQSELELRRGSNVSQEVSEGEEVVNANLFH